MKGPPLYFRSSGRIIKILGRQSISNPMVALLEMIKNSYDADSTEVIVSFDKINSSETRISIKDNGSGMNLDEFDHIWMTAASDNKEKDPRTKKFNRQKIGEKGIARFGLDNLSKKIEIKSMKKGEDRGFKLSIDWSLYEQPDAQFEKIPLIPEFFEKKKSSHGFEIILSDLRSKWSTEDIINLKKEAETIVPPTSQAENFSVKIKCTDLPDLADIRVKNAFLKQSIYTFSAELDKEGKISYWMTDGGKKKRYGPSVPARKYKCGPLRFRFHFFYREAGKYKKLLFGIDEIRGFLDSWGGVKLYRDNFRVKPYGDPGNDWLGFDDTRVQNPSIFPGNNQVFGFIEITKKYNPDLTDTTTREGLIKNESYDDLIRFVKDAVYFFGYARKTLEGKRLGKDKTKEKKKAVKIQIPKKLLKPELPKELVFDFDQIKIPEEIRGSLLADVEEMKNCFRIGSYRATLMFSGLILETLLARKYFEKTGKDLLQESWRLGPLLGKCKDENIITSNDEIFDFANIINKTRIKSVHKKSDIYIPTPEEATSVVGLTNSTLKKLFK